MLDRTKTQKKGQKTTKICANTHTPPKHVFIISLNKKN